jgi:UDP-glucose:(heptosyl)LPS alpha-1,3-glucosyltransferase
VITSRFNGVAELIEEGKSGFVLKDPLDAGEIARCITELGEENLRLEMGRGARLAVQELTMVRNSRESLAVLESVIKGAQHRIPGGSS